MSALRAVGAVLRRGAIVAALAIAAAACGGAATDATPTTASPTAAPSLSPSPSPSPSAPVAATSTPVVATSIVPCSKDYLVPWFKSFIDGTAPDLVIDDVDIVACGNGYAHVWAIPKQNPEGMSNYDGEQFWLRWENDDWVGVASGTGITCSDPDRTPEHAAACDALGES